MTIHCFTPDWQLRSKEWRGIIRAEKPYKGANKKSLGWMDRVKLKVKHNYWIDDTACFSAKTFGVIHLLLWLRLFTVSSMPVNWQLPVSLAGCGVASYAQGSHTITRVEMAAVDGPGETSGEAQFGRPELTNNYRSITDRWRYMFSVNVTQIW